MATRRLEDHDHDLNGHRQLLSMGLPATFDFNGDLILGNGNFFRVTAATANKVLGRISTANWLSGAWIVLRFNEAGLSIENGRTAGGGFSGIATDTGSTMAMASGQLILFILDGSTWTMSMGGGVELSDEMPLELDGTGSPGVGDKASRHDHKHKIKLPDPVADGSYLYTANIPDPLLRPEAKALIQHGEGYGFGSLWEQISGISTWCLTGYHGRLYGRDASGDATIPFEDGDVAAVFTSVPYSDDVVHFALYEIVDCGEHWDGNPEHVHVTTSPVIRRHPLANTSSGLCNGMTFQITGSLAEYEGEYFTVTASDPITVDVTPITMSHSSSYTPNDTPALLTQSQLVSEHADSIDHDDSIECLDAGVHYFPIVDFKTVAGLGVNSIPAGLFTGYVELLRVDAISGTTTFGWEVWRIDSDGDPVGASPILTLESPPLTDEAIPYSFQIPLAVAAAMDLGDGLQAKPFCRCTAAVTCRYRWSSANRGTKIQTTLTMAASGSTNHLLLDHVAQDVGAGETPDHPWCAIGPTGREHHAVGTASIASGVITIPAGYNWARLVLSGGTTEIKGIDLTGFLDGGDAEILIQAFESFMAVIKHNATVVSPAKAIGCPPSPTGPGKMTGADYKIYNEAWVHFRYDGGGSCWRIVSLFGTSEVGS